MPLTIDDIAPDRASYRPGEDAQITIALTNRQPTGVRGRLVLRLTWLDKMVVQSEQAAAIGPSMSMSVVFALTPPRTAPRGYGLDAALYDAAGHALAEGSGALDVLDRWSQAPRYGFLSDFAPVQADVPARCNSLCRYHLNVVQFYDWMWRHYALLPPDDDFTDALGRRLSLATVREAIAAVRARGGAALAYGAVYGAEPEFADAHPELALFDETGERVSLAELFYIMNIAPGSPWVPLIVAEFAHAVRRLGFDGIHLDQYGFPKTARTATGELVDLAEHFPPLIDAARAAVVAERPGAGVIFNAVGNWPIETVAATTQDVVYIEVWPPDESYNDLRRLIGAARGLSGGKQVILAAYLAPFAQADVATLPQAEAAALLATAAIAASGGSHLLLGEHDGILCDPYYPKYATLRAGFAARMRAYYDFLVRYEEWLIAPEIEDCEADETQPCDLRGARLSRQAEARAVWCIPRRKPGYRIIHLINLADQADDAWNALRTPPQPLRQIELSLQSLPAIRSALVLTPDAHLGRSAPLAVSQEDHITRLGPIDLHVWAVIICNVY
jgi:dextranase